MNSSVSEFGKDMELMHKVVVIGRKVGFTPENWGRMAHDRKIMTAFLEVLNNRAEIKQVEYLIDFDKPPSIPRGWTLLPDSKQLPNRVQGQVKFDLTKIKLHLDNAQKNGGYIEGNKLRKKLETISVYGAQCGDFLYANQRLIPKEWRGKAILFWGSIYRETDDNVCVRCLCCISGRWVWRYVWLGADCYSDGPAAARSAS